MSFTRTTLSITVVVLLLSILISLIWDQETQRNLKTIENWAEKNKIILNKEKNKEKEFKIEFNQNEWNNLLNKLNNTRYFEPLDLQYVNSFEFGFDIDLAKELIDYWRTKFNWKNQVNELNRFKHYKIQFEDITLHYVRANNFESNIKSKNSKKIPLLLLNGWPSTVFEMYKAIDYIEANYNNDKQYYDIIVPSIPGYGYSTPLNRPFDAADVARVYDALMRHLFGENCVYYVHGEDWGSIIANFLAQLYPNRVKGIHVTMVSPTASLDKKRILTTIFTDLFPSYMLSEEEKASNLTFTFYKRFMHILKMTGYFHMQATTPDTLGFGLTDSPIGLMTYLVEKYLAGSFSSKNIYGTKDGQINKLSRDDLLTMVTYYWMTNTITSSMRLYKCQMYQLAAEPPKSYIAKAETPSKVPVSLVYVPYEVDHTPYSVARRLFGNLTQYTILKKGGHFGAYLETKLVIDDFIKFIRSLN